MEGRLLALDYETYKNASEERAAVFVLISILSCHSPLIGQIHANRSQGRAVRRSHGSQG